MPSYSKHDVILVRYPFTDLTGSKVRPAIVIGSPHTSHDIFIVPLTSRTIPLLEGEFVLTDWKGSGLNVASAVKRGIYTVHQAVVARKVGKLSADDVMRLEVALRDWLALR
jgi:mRNA interferase MazF